MISQKYLLVSCKLFYAWVRLQCEPSQILRPHKSKWDTCPAMQCESESLSLGNTNSNGCSQCTYVGYNETSILTSLSTLSTCSSKSALFFRIHSIMQVVYEQQHLNPKCSPNLCSAERFFLYLSTILFHH